MTINTIVNSKDNLELLRDNINLLKHKIDVINDELHSNIPTKKGLVYQINDLNEAIFDIKRIIHIGIGIMLIINILPQLKTILTILR